MATNARRASQFSEPTVITFGPAFSTGCDDGVEVEVPMDDDVWFGAHELFDVGYEVAADKVRVDVGDARVELAADAFMSVERASGLMLAGRSMPPSMAIIASGIGSGKMATRLTGAPTWMCCAAMIDDVDRRGRGLGRQYPEQQKSADKASATRFMHHP